MKDQIENYFKGNYEVFYGKYLSKIKKIGGEEYETICPFHDDRNPSFNFNNQTGQWLCRGCGKKGNGFHFYARLNGFDTRRDFPKILKGIASDFGIDWEEKKGRIVKTYDYLNAEGTLHSQTVRMDPKDFWQRRPDGKEGWITKNVFKGHPPILYRLPEVLKATEVIIVEGEKDVDSLMELGFTATTCPMGANKWEKWSDSYNSSLKGKDIVLIPDNDNEGREHMTKVGISLNGTSKTLKWIDLPGLPSKGDVSDWVKKREDSTDAGERLAIMIENADPYEPPKKASLEDAILDAKEFNLVEVSPKLELLKPWIKEQSINLTSGWRGTGKTWLALGIVDAITKGISFGPWQVETSVPCLFLDGEMPVQDIMERLTGLGANSERKNPLYIYSDAYANHLGLPRAHLGHENWRTKMKSILMTKKVKLWVIDNLASLASGLDENSKKDWDPINAWLLELRFAGIATMMLHHVSKEGLQRGTSAREDNIDTSIILKVPYDYTPEDGARFVLHFSKARVSTKDLNLIADTEFKLSEDEVGQITWTWGNVKKENRRAVLECMDQGMDQKAICETLSLSKGYVSKIISKAISDGHLSKKKDLTQSGHKIAYGL